MIITKIKILKSKVVLYFGKKRLELDKDVYPNFYLYEGKDLSDKEIKEIKNQNDSASYLRFALNLRSKKLYSEYAMREKLYKKGASKRITDSVIKSLKNFDLIDDNAFISDFIAYYNSLNYGENKIKEKLRQKGIFEEKISKIKFPISLEKKKAKAVLPKLEKKYDSYNNSSKETHIYNSLLQYGFSGEVAKETVGLVKQSSPKEENKKLEKDFDKVVERLKKKYQKKELKQKVLNSLLTKGYKFNDIYKMMERKKL